jgi:hypothetical protein
LLKNGKNIRNIKRNETNKSLGKITEFHRRYIKTWVGEFRHVVEENKGGYKIKLKIIWSMKY